MTLALGSKTFIWTSYNGFTLDTRVRKTYSAPAKVEKCGSKSVDVSFRKSRASQA